MTRQLSRGLWTGLCVLGIGVSSAAVSFGPTGGAGLTPTTYIQRVNTSGGVAPASGCDKSRDIGALALVPYATDYYFYRTQQ